MLPALLLAADLTALTAPTCSAEAVRAAVSHSVEALKAKDRGGAKAALASVETCPITSTGAYLAHVLRADLAVQDADWAGARSALSGAPLKGELPFSDRVAFIRLRADEKLDDKTAFRDDRAAALAAVDARLRAKGRFIETFRAAAATVSAYDAPVTHGSFKRSTEFVITPDDPAAYPLSVQLGTDAMVTQNASALGLSGGEIWFLDLYTCGLHATLPPPAAGRRPTYDQAKAAVITAVNAQLSGGSARPPDASYCGTWRWLLPGLGAS